MRRKRPGSCCAQADARELEVGQVPVLLPEGGPLSSLFRRHGTPHPIPLAVRLRLWAEFRMAEAG